MGKFPLFLTLPLGTPSKKKEKNVTNVNNSNNNIICIDFLSNKSSQKAKFTGDRHMENYFGGIPLSILIGKRLEKDLTNVTLGQVQPPPPPLPPKSGKKYF